MLMLFLPLNTFKARVSEFINTIRSSRQKGDRKIFVAGDKEAITYQFRRKHGIPLTAHDAAVFSSLEKVFG